MPGQIKLKLIDLRKFGKYQYEGDRGDHFLIENVTNSTRFECGSFVSTDYVNKLIQHDGMYDIAIRAATESDFKKYGL